MNQQSHGTSRGQARRAAAAILLAAAVSGMLAGSSRAAADDGVNSSALVSLVQGECQLKSRAQIGWTTLPAKSILRPGDAVKTGRLARLVITFADGTRLRINENSVVNLIQNELKSNTWSTIVELLVGQAWARVTKGRGQFAIKGEHAVAASMGTEFRMDTDAQATRTIVYEGLVDVHRPAPADQLAALLATQPIPRSYTERGVMQAHLPAPAVPGSPSTAIDQWVRLAVNQAIEMNAKGRSQVVSLDQRPESENEWIRWNRERDRQEAAGP